VQLSKTLSTLARTGRNIVLALSVLGLTGTPMLAQQAAPKVMSRPGEDAAMDAAIAKARASIATFWASLEKPKPEERGFSLKVKMPTADGNFEHIWVREITRKGDEITAQLANDPQNLPKLRSGSPIAFKESDVSDWLFMRNGKMVGNETMRPLLADMPPDIAAKYRAMLETP
jgi:uncharacterized protein YegJ (DUF2314 family)